MNVVDSSGWLEFFAADAKLPMADAVMLATARALGATLWTQDADFAEIEGVRYVPAR
jgi:predicted nucleic acid-binding protein